MTTYRIYIHNGYEYEWTRHTVIAKTVFEARKIWKQIGSSSETRKFKVSAE